MKLYKNFLVTLSAVLAMMFSCSQGSEVSDSKLADGSGANLTVNIVAPVTRTVRPTIDKYELTLASKDGKNVISRILNKPAVSTTFKNIPAKTYKLTVKGFIKFTDKDGKEVDIQIVEGEIENITVDPSGENNLFCNIEVEDCYDNTAGKGGVKIIFKFGDQFKKYFYSIVEDFNLSSTPPIPAVRLNPIYNPNASNGESLLFWDFTPIINENIDNEQKMIAEIQTMVRDDLADGEIDVETDGLTPGSYRVEVTGLDGFELVQDPLINVYPGNTTIAEWELNDEQLEKSTTAKTNNVKIPVWNVDAQTEAVGYIDSTALFGKPKFISGEFVSSAYDSEHNLWILSKILSKDNSNQSGPFSYVLSEILAEGMGKSYTLNNPDITDIKDFTITTVGDKKYALFLTMRGVYKFELTEDSLGEDLNNSIISVSELNGTVTAIAANGNNCYIAVNEFVDEYNFEIVIAIYKADLSNSADTFEKVNYNSGDESIGSKFGTNVKFTNESNNVTDMYFDGTGLYITVGAIEYHIPDPQQQNKRLGGLFKYTISKSTNAAGTEQEILTLSDSRIDHQGIMTDYTGELSVPRCIVPGKNGELYIVDSCFGMDQNNPVKNSRVLVFKKDNFSELLEKTDLHDSVDFDFNKILGVFNAVNGAYYF